jgi:hypothetical protein
MGFDARHHRLEERLETDILLPYYLKIPLQQEQQELLVIEFTCQRLEPSLQHDQSVSNN